MKKRFNVSLLVFLCLGAILSCQQNKSLLTLPGAESAKGLFKVKRVIDGDTIELINGAMVRYLGVDTPEVRKKDGSGNWVYEPQPFALAAKEVNRNLVEGKEVRLEFDVEKRDKYNRLLAYCFVGDKFINAELLEEGLALLYTSPPNVKYTDLFVEKLRAARKLHKGIWSIDEIITPLAAKDFIGTVKTIQGEFAKVKNRNNLTVISFERGKSSNGFKAVVFGQDLETFRRRGISVQDYAGKTLKISGIIKEYKSSPEIIIRDPSQIEVIGG